MGKINKGGINGIGEQAVNTQSEDFKALKNSINVIAKNRSREELLSNQLLGLRFRMMSYLENSEVESVIPAGEFLRQAVALTGIKHKAFAKYISIEAPNVSAIYKGKRKINISLALKLEAIFRIPAMLWLQVQNFNAMHNRIKDNNTDLSLAGLLKVEK